MVLSSQQSKNRIHTPHRKAAWVDVINRPWVILISITPLLVLDAIGIGRVAQTPDTLARRQLHGLLGFFDIPPQLALASTICILCAVLMTWHILQRDPWRLKPIAPVGIAIEGLAWSIPLLLLSSLFSAAILAAGTTAQGIAELPTMDRLLISVAAGLDEEMIFRMAGIALLHTIIVDVFRLKQGTGTMLAIAGTAVLFAWYHDPGFTAPPQLLFSLLAGIYLGVLYILRGFGIVVWTHVLYDVSVTILFA